MSISLDSQQLVALTGATKVEGEYLGKVRSLASLAEAGPEDLSFLGNPKYATEVPTSRAGVILVPSDYVGQPAAGQAFLRVAKPSYALALVCAAIEAQLWPKPAAGIHATAVVDATAVIDASAYVGPLCVIGAGAHVGAGAVIEAQCMIGVQAVVGAGCWLKNGVTLADYCRLGARCRLQPGVVVGADGFGYEPAGGQIHRIPQIGNVVLEDDVDVGANTTIDRARLARRSSAAVPRSIT